MAASVRLFVHGGITTAFVNPASGRYSSDSVGLLSQPYIAKQTISANTGGAQSSNAALSENSKSKLLHMQVESGKVIAVEVNPENRTTVATTDSPYYSGDVTVEFGKGWTVSILEVTPS